MKIIAIDGPSGSGKGTIAKEVAKRLGYTYVDTGAMYRCVSLKSLREGLEEKDEENIVNLLKDMDIKLTNDGKVFLDGEDVSDKIRTMEVTHRVSKISSIIALREVMRDKQHELASNNDIVMEGRDITTEVFPNADYKFYLDASVEERAERDYDDMHRPVGALTRTDDQIYIDSSNMTIEEVINKILNIVGE